MLVGIYMKASGEETKSMVKEYFNGQTEKDITVNGLGAKGKVSASLCLQTEKNI